MQRTYVFGFHRLGRTASWGLWVVMMAMLTASLAQADLVQYWKFDETSGTSAANSVTGGLAGTLMAGEAAFPTTPQVNPSPVWSTDVPTGLGHSTGSLQFEETLAEWVNVGPLGMLCNNQAASLDGVTVSMWIKPGDDLHTTQLYDWTNDSNNTSASSLGYQNGGPRLTNDDTGSNPAKLTIMGRKSDNTTYHWRDLTAAETILTDQWQHVAITYVGDAAFCYVNGEIHHRIAGYRTAFTFDATAGFGIGCSRNVLFDPQQECFDGLIDDVAIWNTALTPAAVAQLAAGADPTTIVERPDKPTYSRVVNIDIESVGSPTYSGKAAIADMTGTHWNSAVITGSENFQYGCNVTDALDSEQNATTVDFTCSEFYQPRSDGVNTTWGEDPHPLMGDRLLSRRSTDGGVDDWEISGLDIGTTYDIYFYGFIEQTINLTAGAAPGSAEILMDAGGLYFRLQDTQPDDFVEGLHYTVLRVTPTATTIAGSVDPSETMTYSRGGFLCGIQVATVVTDSIPGDTNNDKIVDAVDAETLADHWGQTIAGGPAVGDFNNDGKIDMADASIMAANWGNHTAESSAVPEPATLAMVLALPLLLLVRRRR